MKILFYNAAENATGLSVLELTASMVPREQIKTCRSLDELEAKLCEPNVRFGLAVILVNTVEEIDHLITLKNLLDDVRIILITPDLKKDTVHKGHKLYPRFMTDTVDMHHLAAIIKKNLSNLNTPQLSAARRCSEQRPAVQPDWDDDSVTTMSGKGKTDEL